MIIKLFGRLWKLTKGQMGLFDAPEPRLQTVQLDEPKRIHQPGSRGGKFYYDKKGNVVYGTRPPTKAKLKTDEVTPDGRGLMDKYLAQLKAEKDKRLERKQKKTDSPGLFDEVKNKQDAKRKAKDLNQEVQSVRSGKKKMKTIRQQAMLDLFADKKVQIKPLAKQKETKEAISEPTQDIVEKQNDPVEYFEQSIEKSGKEPRLTPSERVNANKRAREILDKPIDQISDAEKAELKKYTGRGGLAGKGEGGKGVLSEYYTDTTIIHFMYAMAKKMGFEGGSILEPSCGTGKFIENRPAGTSATGVELDMTSGKIASILNDDAMIHQKAFEVFQVSNQEKYDLTIGNIPFGDRISINGNIKLDKPEERSADRYFVERSIDNTKENGLVAVISMHSLLTGSINKDYRRGLLNKAEFLGAVRLPSGTFTHTSVVADVLFFKKRPDNVATTLDSIGEKNEQINSIINDKGKPFIEGNYFKTRNGVKNILGEEDLNNMYYKVKGKVTNDALEQTIKSFSALSQPILEKDIKAAGVEIVSPGKTGDDILLTEQDQKDLIEGTLFTGMIRTINGRTYILNKNHRWERLDKRYQSDDNVKKFESFHEIHKKADEIKTAMKEGKTEETKKLQTDVRELLDKHEKQFGSAENDNDLKTFLNSHRYAKGIQNIVGLKKPDGNYSDLLTKENIFSSNVGGESLFDPDSLESVANYINDELKIDVTPSEIAKYYKEKSLIKIREEMMNSKDIFFDGERFYTEPEYLQGTVVDKLDLMQKLIESDPTNKEKYKNQMLTIEKTAGFKTTADIELHLRDSWVPRDIQLEYIHKVMKATEIEYDNETRQWIETTGKYTDKDIVTYNRQVMYHLNGQRQRSQNVDTEAYNKRVDEEFKLWVLDNPKFSEQIENKYNHTFKNYMIERADAHLPEINGMNTDIVLNRAQKESINFLNKRGKGISALGTGFGKTFVGVAVHMYRKQLGLENKAFLQVPNNKVQDWKNEILRLFPNAKVLTIDADFETTNDLITKKLQEAANNDFDFVVCAQSKAGLIGVSPEFEYTLRDEIYLQTNGEFPPVAKDENLNDPKEREKQKKLNAFNVMLERDRKEKLTGISFEDLGCDAIYIDEAHHYKNLWKPNKQKHNVAIGAKMGQKSNRADELWKKTEFVRKQNNDSNVFLMTATPFSNSALEYYNMLQYISPDEAKMGGSLCIDDFVENNADIERILVPSWRDGGMVEKDTFMGYKDTAKLKTLVEKYIDYKGDKEYQKYGINRPDTNEVKHYVQPSYEQLQAIGEMRKELIEWSKMDSEARKESGKNALTFWSDFRAAALDLELIDSQKYKGMPNPKIDQIVNLAKDDYAKTKAGQLIFCDRVFSKDKKFNLHDKIKDYFVRAGFKPSEVAVVNGHAKGGAKLKDEQLESVIQKTVNDFNSGKIKVLIGTTPTMGEGLNLQKNSSNLLNLDIPHRPTDYEQRKGRIVRQGNEQEQVGVHYVFGTGIDRAAFEMISRKEDMIGELLDIDKKFGIDEDKDEINYMSPLGLQLATADSEEERIEIMAQIRKEQQQKKLAVKRQASIDNFKQYVQIHNAMLKVPDKESNAYKINKERLEALKNQLKQNEHFKHTKHFDSNEPMLFNVVRNEVIKVGDHVKVDRYGGDYEIYKVDKIFPGAGTFSGITASGKTIKPQSSKYSYSTGEARPKTVSGQSILGSSGSKIESVAPENLNREVAQEKIRDGLPKYGVTNYMQAFKEMKMSDEDINTHSQYIKDILNESSKAKLNQFLVTEKGKNDIISPFNEENELKENLDVVLPTIENKKIVRDGLINLAKNNVEKLNEFINTAKAYYDDNEFEKIKSDVNHALFNKLGEDKYIDKIFQSHGKYSPTDAAQELIQFKTDKKFRENIAKKLASMEYNSGYYFKNEGGELVPSAHYENFNLKEHVLTTPEEAINILKERIKKNRVIGYEDSKYMDKNLGWKQQQELIKFAKEINKSIIGQLYGKRVIIRRK